MGYSDSPSIDSFWTDHSDYNTNDMVWLKIDSCGLAIIGRSGLRTSYGNSKVDQTYQIRLFPHWLELNNFLLIQLHVLEILAFCFLKFDFYMIFALIVVEAALLNLCNSQIWSIFQNIQGIVLWNLHPPCFGDIFQLT